MTRRKVLALQASGLLLFVLAWELAGSSAPNIYSRPVLVAAEFEAMLAQGALLTVLRSLAVLAVGLAAAITAGVAIGMVVGRYHDAAVVAEPLLAGLYATPRIAFVPLLTFWLGIDYESVFAMTVFAAVFLVIFPTIAGVRQADQTYVEVARSFRLSRRDEFLKVILPAALPYIATGLRLAVQAGLVGLIVAEFLYGIPGLGSLIKRASAQRDVDRIFALAIVTMVIGFVLVELMTRLERRLSRWRPEAFRVGSV